MPAIAFYRPSFVGHCVEGLVIVVDSVVLVIIVEVVEYSVNFWVIVVGFFRVS